MNLREAKAEAARLIATKGVRQVDIWQRPLRVERPDAPPVFKLVTDGSDQGKPWELAAIVR